MRALIFTLHEFARDAGIDDLPGKNFIVAAAAAGVKMRIDSGFAKHRVQITIQARRCFNHLRLYFLASFGVKNAAN